MLLITVYPRVYGGTNLLRPWLLQWGGLSPRLRGSPAHALPAILPQHAQRAKTCGREAEARPKKRSRTPYYSI